MAVKLFPYFIDQRKEALLCSITPGTRGGGGGEGKELEKEYEEEKEGRIKDEGLGPIVGLIMGVSAVHILGLAPSIGFSIFTK